ncbi:MAG: 23S rRNA (pseudouridine(1915)-N(3))-methyltransferase RlmH [Gammaproteobacteria bacterium]|nr:23S rRNA (pseudouridine(1915)-N(3))-methyltransferase RlmH [Gammaproteobacteria bacterium]
MRFELLCVSKRPAGWVASASDEYLARLQGKIALKCRELSPITNAATPEQQRSKEGTVILRAIGPGSIVVALDERGEQWSTTELAERLTQWREAAQDVVFVVGGAEGLAPEVRAAAVHTWALSRLTLPHQLVRVIVLEQLYRAWSWLQGHPYHRA